MSFKFKPFQREDYARMAIPDGCVNGSDTGTGKTMALYTWPLLKLGLAEEKLPLRPAKPVLLVVPGDGHTQTCDEGREHFKTCPITLDSQAAFIRLSQPCPRTGRRELPPHYYLTSYTQLAQNGVVPFPKLCRNNPITTLRALHVDEAEAVRLFADRARLFRHEYGRLEVTPETPWPQVTSVWMKWRKQYTLSNVAGSMDAAITSLDAAYYTLKKITPVRGKTWECLGPDQQQFFLAELAAAKHCEYSSGIDTSRHYPDGRTVNCIYSPSLADLAQDCFAAIVVDEGTRIQGEDTIIGTGVRQINARCRLVMTATPIKNRFPQVFHLVHYASGRHVEPTGRFPYGIDGQEQFAADFMVTERNLTKEAEQGRRFVKRTPQVCNVHLAWKLLAPNILRRRKEDCGEDIVKKVWHTIRVPMGTKQAEVYKFHLAAKYRDRHNLPAMGPKLAALRIASANPASQLLQRPENDDTTGLIRSTQTYIPKVASGLSLVRNILQAGEQVVLFAAFHDALDAFSARLREAGVPHLVMDGRLSPKRRGEYARMFKQGPPRARSAGLTKRISDYPVMLASVECMAELHSFPLCNNVIRTAYSWSLDKCEQGINRVHRMNSPWDVNVWSLVCSGSMDVRLEGNIQEKGDASALILDGKLQDVYASEVNLADVLYNAQKDFAAAQTISETVLEKDWPALRSSLATAFKDWHQATIAQPCSFSPDEYSDLPLFRIAA